MQTFGYLDYHFLTNIDSVWLKNRVRLVIPVIKNTHINTYIFAYLQKKKFLYYLFMYSFFGQFKNMRIYVPEVPTDNRNIKLELKVIIIIFRNHCSRSDYWKL